MIAPQMRDMVAFQTRRESDGIEYEWQTVATARASVKPMSGGEAVREARIAGTTTYAIKCRCSEALRGVTSSAYRLLDARDLTREFNVVSLLIDDRRRWIDIIATAGTAVAT